jgi:hypothetical protein
VRTGRSLAPASGWFGNLGEIGFVQVCDGPWLILEAPFLILPIFGRR